MGFYVGDGHDTRSSQDVSRSTTRVPIGDVVRHRAVLCCLCGRYGCFGICGGQMGSYGPRFLVMVRGGGGTSRELGVWGAGTLGSGLYFPYASYAYFSCV